MADLNENQEWWLRELRPLVPLIRGLKVLGWILAIQGILVIILLVVMLVKFYLLP